MQIASVSLRNFKQKKLMGLFDFFKKGEEKPVAKKVDVNTKTSPAQPTSSGRSYTIKSGDSLSKIAKQFYGNASEWDKIYKANQDKIKDPNMIHPGQQIIIP